MIAGPALQPGSNGGEHAVGFVHHIPGREAQHGEAASAEIVVAGRVVALCTIALVAEAVDLDDLDTDADELSAPEPSSRRGVTQDQRAQMRRSLSMPEIPRAPMVPRFAPVTNTAPSYAPASRTASLSVMVRCSTTTAVASVSK